MSTPLLHEIDFGPEMRVMFSQAHGNNVHVFYHPHGDPSPHYNIYVAKAHIITDTWRDLDALSAQAVLFHLLDDTPEVSLEGGSRVSRG